MKAIVGAFNQEKALVGAFSVIVQPIVEPMEHYTAAVTTPTPSHSHPPLLPGLALVRGVGVRVDVVRVDVEWDQPQRGEGGRVHWTVDTLYILASVSC